MESPLCQKLFFMKEIGVMNVLQNLNRPFIKCIHIWYFHSFCSIWNLPLVSRIYMPSLYQNINFSIEYEEPDSLSFLDVKICRINYQLVNRVYRNPTFIGVFTYYWSFFSIHQKKGLSYSLMHRSFAVIRSNAVISTNFIWKLTI